jgi:hypothetical protein
LYAGVVDQAYNVRPELENEHRRSNSETYLPVLRSSQL